MWHGSFQLRGRGYIQKAKWEQLLRVISQKQSSNHHVQQTLPRELEKSQTSSHYSEQNGQRDTRGNMRRKEGRRKEAEDKWDKLRKKCASRGIERWRRKRWEMDEKQIEKWEKKGNWSKKEGKAELRRRWRKDKDKWWARQLENRDRKGKLNVSDSCFITLPNSRL